MTESVQSEGRPFQLVDVFGEAPFDGNPVAVVMDGVGLTDEQMQRITRWLNLSETTFLLPPTDPEADYRVRIFTLERELPFAGHPTLGSAHTWLRAGGRPRRNKELVQECGAGLVRLRPVDGRISFAAPPLLRSGAVEAARLEEICQVLGIAPADVVDAAWCDNGPGWIAVLLDDAEAVRAVRPAGAHPSRVDIGIVGLYPQGDEPALEVRAIFSDQTGALREDPVTGSLNAAVAQWLIASGRLPGRYVAAQGRCIGHAGRIHVKRDEAGEIWIAGTTRTLFEGLSSFE
jgi:PhzF family phenazine biosynthesis protein